MRLLSALQEEHNQILLRMERLANLPGEDAEKEWEREYQQLLGSRRKIEAEIDTYRN